MLTRMVNGKRETIPSSEETQIRAEWAKNISEAPAKEAARKEARKEQLLDSPEFDSLLIVIAPKVNITKAALRAQIKAKMVIP